ncbi:MAG: TatD family hydrolase [Candidatus Schekmanbacteria bacterium]|nr:TatD family hydrolase [Candidatus Schekmanbacteria bacterium]
MYVDVHAHLVHPAFAGEEDAVAGRAAAAGVEMVVVTGLEPRSNRAVLELCERHAHLLPALGIYPVDALCKLVDRSSWQHPFPPPERFDVEEEIAFIDSVAGRLVAIAEVGLDQYWVPDYPREQEETLRKLCAVAMRHDLPVVLHSRKAESRTFAVVREMGVARAVFHCFGGKLNLARQIADHGYCFSIPPVVERAEAFQALCRALPLDRLLTETDCPYLGPDRDQRNEPANIPRAVRAMAAARKIPEREMAAAVRANFRRTFGR